MNKKIIFRFEASAKIGAGHAIRSMVLANQFQELNWNVLIATSMDSYNCITDLNAFEIINPESLFDGAHFCDILVIDSYEIDEKIENYFRKYSNKIIVIDDLANRHHACDILIDQTYGRLESDYQNLVPKGCEILTGSSFAMIRDSFLKYRSKALEKRKNTYKINKILVSLGGWDQKGLTQKILEELIEAGFNGEIDLVIGFVNGLDQGLLNYINSLPNIINTHVNPDMAKLMFEADFAITGSGSSVWERCCLGLPGVLILTAENQLLIFNNLINEKFFYSLGSLALAFTRAHSTIQNIFSLCDGMGSTKIMNKILEKKYEQPQSQ